MSYHFRKEHSPHLSAASPAERVQYDLSWIDYNGQVQFQSRMITLSALSESACASLARGSLVQTEDGLKAVEDLIPGDRLHCASGGTETLQWIGARTYGSHLSEEKRPDLIRVSAGCFGDINPARDTVLAANASILVDNPACLSIIGQRQAFAPLSAFEDGISISRLTPPGEIALYNVAFRQQEAILVNGMAVETYHPGREAMLLMNDARQSDLSRLFPHIESNAGFGSATVPRLSVTEAHMLAAA